MIALDDQDLFMISGIRHGRIRDVERDVRDQRTFRKLIAQQIIFTKSSRPQVPRSSADFSRSLRRHGQITMVQREEVHLTATGLRAYAEYFHHHGARKDRSKR